MNTQLNHFKESLKRNGKVIVVNNLSIKAIAKELSDGTNSIDTKELLTTEALRQGEILSYHSLNYMVVTKNETINEVYGTYIIKNCPFIVKIDCNNIMGIFPMYCDKQSFDLSSPVSGGVGVVPVNTIMVTIQNTQPSMGIALGTYFYKFNSLWQISGKDRTKDGLLVLTCDWTMGNGSYPDDEMYWMKHDYGISVLPSEGNLYLGDTLQLDANPTDHDNSIEGDLSNPVTYLSSNTAIATVSSTGLVTSKTLGICSIICSINKGDEWDDEGNPLKMSAIVALEIYNYSMVSTPTLSDVSIGSSLQVSTVVSRSGVAIVSPSLTYSSSNIEVATVTSQGLINGLASGNSIITVTYIDVDGNIYYNTITIAVESAHNYVFTVSPTSISVDINAMSQLTPTVTDKGIAVSSPIVTYSSDNTSMATVSDTGLVTGVGEGTNTIYANYVGEDGANYTVTIPMTITVPIPDHIYDFTVNPTSVSGDVGDISYINPIVYDKGEYVSNATFTFSSDNEAIATVVGDVDYGNSITGNAEGTCNVTVTYIGLDSVTYTFVVPVTVTVYVAPPDVYVITAEDGTVVAGKSLSPSYNQTVNGYYMSWAVITGVSSDESIFTYDGYYIYGVAEGTATFTVSFVGDDGITYSATSTITVTAAPHEVVKSFTVSPTTLSLGKVTTSQLTAAYLEDGVAAESPFPLSFKTSKATVATVSSSGLITTKSLVGTCVISAVWTDENAYDDYGNYLTYTAPCSVSVHA